MVNPFYFQTDISGFKIREVEHRRNWTLSTVEFPVAFPGLFYESNTAYGEYYKNNRVKKSPLLILVHGWGDHSAVPIRFLAKKFAANGTNCFVLFLPFHSRRLPAEMKPRSPDFTENEWFNGYRIAVTDVMKIIDWANQNEDIDVQKIAYVGLSLGAFVGSIVMGIDSRIRAGVFIVSGGNSTKIQQYSRFSRFRKQYRLDKKDYEEYQRVYHRYLDEITVAGWEKVDPAKQYFLIDPLTYAHMLKERPVLMLNAMWDEFVPRETTLELNQSLGNSELVWFPATHPTIWAFYPIIANYIRQFLNKSLG
jgi:pimeloyl-ACP methyl ester carboxylesterase